MEIVVYEDNKDKIAILERKNIWEDFRKYRKGKFPHFLYLFLSIIVSILVFIYFGIIEYGCSPFKVVRELGLERRETVGPYLPWALEN